MIRMILFEWRKIRKNGVSSLAAMLGLCLGMVVFILGFLYIDEELSYDKGFSAHNRIFRIERNYPDKHLGVMGPRGFAELVAGKIPGIDCLTKFSEIPIEQPLLKTKNEKSVFIEHLFHSDSSFFKVFDYPFVFGEKARALSQARSIVLSKSVAAALFHDKDPVGSSLSLGEQGNYMVTGVFDNGSFPSHLSLDAVVLMPSLAPGEDAWKNNAVFTYVRLHPGVSPGAVERSLTAKFQPLPEDWKLGGTSLVLDPITDIYIHSHNQGELDLFKRGNETALWLVGCLILFILAASLLNFANLILTEALSRIKEIAVRRVLGSARFSIAIQLYVGVALRCLLAFAGAILVIFLLLPLLEQLLQVKFMLFTGRAPIIAWKMALLLLAVVGIAGAYPLFYISVAHIASVLKGNFSNGQKGNRLRKGLLIVQFAITCVFIGGVSIISRQLEYLSDRDLGFNSHQVLVIRYGQFQTQFQYSRIKNLLLQEPGVQNLSYCSEGGLLKQKFVMPMTIDGLSVTPHYLCVDTGYFAVLGAHLYEGRNFSSIDTGRTLVINRTLATMANIKGVDPVRPVTAFNKPARIVGIVDDLNLYGFENTIGPMAFAISAPTLKPFILVKLNSPKPRATIAAIEKVWKTIEPGFPLRYQFLDQSFEQIYKGYERVNAIFRFFSLCAILLAFSGLFSLSALLILQRSKEITIRKIHGAPKWSVVLLLNRSFIGLIIAANLFAVPITYFLSVKWLDHFVYRISFSAFPFLFSLIASLLLTVITVSLQSLKIVSAPVANGLRQD
jgi:putative ABC transport system permease protein